MGARHAFWVILAGAIPTAFRSARREDLIPTLRQLQRTQPDVSLHWFDRGRIWSSPEEARAALLQARRPAGRGKDWRPGGAHKDPRARYKLTRDQKRLRWKKRFEQSKTSSPPADEAPPAAARGRRDPTRPPHKRSNRPQRRFGHKPNSGKPRKPR